MTWRIGENVPWNAMWTGEQVYSVRPCRYAAGRLAIHCQHRPGEGRPVFAKPHMVRQRRSVFEGLCTVCGRATAADDRWWFKLGSFIESGWFATTEAPVHRACADHALKVCPHLKGREADLEPMPGGFQILYSIVGGPVTQTDFKVRLPPEGVVGHLKIAWPPARLRAGGAPLSRTRTPA